MITLGRALDPNKFTPPIEMNGILLILLCLFVIAVGLSFYVTSVNWVIFAVFALLLIALAYAAWHLIGERYGEPLVIKPEHRHHHLVPLSVLLHIGFVVVLIAVVIALFSPHFTTVFTGLPALTQAILVLLFFSFLAASLYLHWLIGGRELYWRMNEAWQNDSRPPRRIVVMEGEEQQPMINKALQQSPMEVVVQPPVDVQRPVVESRILERQLRRHRGEVLGGQ